MLVTINACWQKQTKMLQSIKYLELLLEPISKPALRIIFLLLIQQASDLSLTSYFQFSRWIIWNFLDSTKETPTMAMKRTFSDLHFKYLTGPPHSQVPKLHKDVRSTREWHKNIWQLWVLACGFECAARKCVPWEFAAVPKTVTSRILNGDINVQDGL